MSNVVTKAVEAIYGMDNDQLNQVVEAIKLRRNALIRQMSRSVRIGDSVQFEGRRGLVRGTVIKVNPKTLIVETAAGAKWRVTASMCQKVAEMA